MLKNIEGFTLIEVMLASALFAVVMLYGIAFFSLGQKPATGAQETNYALQVAEDDLEDVKIIGYPAVAAETVTYTSPAGISFTKDRTVVYDSPISKCAAVQVLVTWFPPSSGGVQRSVSLHTVVTRKYPWP